MPMHFHFKYKGSDQLASLNDVDREMCEDTKQTYSDKNYCPMFMFCRDLGSLGHIQNNEGYADLTKLEEYLNKEYPDLNEEERGLIKKYLVDKYEFSAWYTRHK